MKLKIAFVSLFAISGLSIGGFNLFYDSVEPPNPAVEKSVLLAGQDLPAAESFLETQPEPKKASSKTVSQASKDSILASKNSAVLASSSKTTNKGDNLLVLINKSSRLTSSYYPKDLVNLDKSIKTSYGSDQLRKEAAGALLKLFEGAKKKGFALNVNSAYRSYQTQVVTYNYWVSQVGEEEASRFSALPGHSQHQLGTTVDITSASVNYKLLSSFGNTVEGKWLVENSYKYGFVLSYPAGYENITGYTYEPWHFRYIGVGNAKKWKASGLILEQYLQKYGVW